MVYIIFLFNSFIQFIYLLNFISIFNNKSFIIICINKKQAIIWKNTKYFQINIIFKRVYEDINKFEINNYYKNYNQSKKFIFYKYIN